MVTNSDYTLIIFLLKRVLALNFLYPTKLCAKSGWNLPSGYREDFVKSSIYGFFILYFLLVYVTFEKDIVLCVTPPPPLNSLHRRMVCVKFGGNWLNGTKEVLFWRPFTSHMHIRNAFIVRVKYILFNTIICWLPWYAAKIYKHKFPKDFKKGGGV